MMPFDVTGMFGLPGTTGGGGIQNGLGPLQGAMSGGNTPQQKGYGTNYPVPMVPYASGPGLMPGTPQDIQNADLGAAGAGETQFAMNANLYSEPGQQEQWWALNNGAYAGPGIGEGYVASVLDRKFPGGQGAPGTPGSTTGGTQNAQEAYKASLTQQPTIAADMSPFYSNAERKLTEGIDRAMAARGLYSSSAGMDRTAEALTDLAAQQARDEANYGLQRSQNLQGWAGLQGQLASAADQGSRAGSSEELAWITGLGDLALSGQNAWLARMGQAGNLAGAADQAMLGRLGAGQSAAMQAQQAQQSRLQQLWDMEMGLGGALGSAATGAYNDMFADDLALLEAQMMAEAGLTAEAVNQSHRNQERIKKDAEWIKDMFMGMGGGGAGGMAGGLMG